MFSNARIMGAHSEVSMVITIWRAQPSLSRFIVPWFNLIQSSRRFGQPTYNDGISPPWALPAQMRYVGGGCDVFICVERSNGSLEVLPPIRVSGTTSGISSESKESTHGVIRCLSEIPHVCAWLGSSPRIYESGPCITERACPNLRFMFSVSAIFR